MRFLSIHIKNYRQYRDLDLEFYPGSHDLQVIVADNGVGKTNLLNAFTWCLYGDEPHLGTSKNRPSKYKDEPKLNKEVIAECVERGFRIADVRVQIDIEDGEGEDAKLIRIVRTVPFTVNNINTVIEKLAESRLTLTIIHKDSSDYPLEGQSAQEYIDKILPESIRRFFFFDGEQLNSYFKSNNGDRIKEAVYSISRIDLIRTMRERLDTVVRTQRRNAASSSSDTRNISKKLDTAEQTLEGAKNFIAEKTRDAQELKVRISEIGEELRGIPNVAEIEKKRDLARAKKDDLMKKVASAEQDYYTFARERVVDFYLYPIASTALERIRELQNDGQLPPSIDRGRLAEALEVGRCTVCGHELNDEERAKIKEQLELFLVGSKTSNILSGMTAELSRLTEKIKAYPRERKRYIDALNDAHRDLDEMEDAFRELDAQAAKYAETGDKIKKLYADRDKYWAEHEECVRQIGTRQSTISRYESAIKEYKRQLSDATKASEKAAALNRMVELGTRALEVLKKTEQAIVDETRIKMAERTEELFKNLVWKESKCDRIELTDNYIPLLYDKSGFECAGTCSAAERSLLALSFTLAMHEVSGFDSPLFIDTPIARASGDNRENFARTLVEISKNKQLILAFTPDEYSELISKHFEPVISTYIRLRLDPEETHVMKPEVENRAN